MMTGGVGTLTTANTAYSLYTILLANDTSTPQYGHQVSIQSDSGNASPIYIGGANLSTAIYGNSLASPGDSSNFDHPFNGIRLQDIYVLSTGSGQKVNVNVVVV